MNEVEIEEMQVVEEGKKQKNSGVNDFFKKASVMGKKVADNVQKNAVALSEKAKNDSYQRKLEKYNPLFLKEYRHKNFVIPQLIKIVDDASIQAIDVCEGAIGWRDRSGTIEVLILSMDFALKSDLMFYPSLVSGALYYIDAYDELRYVNIEHVFSKAHEEKLAELENIAYSLGAKSCSIELVESDDMIDHRSRDGQTGLQILKASAKEDLRQKNSHKMSGKTVSTFNGNDHPIRPTLKWFKDDKNVLNLIDMRCSNSNAIRSRILILEGASSVTMDQNLARNIDLTSSKIGFKLSSSMEKQYQKEYRSKLIFEVEF